MKSEPINDTTSDADVVSFALNLVAEAERINRQLDEVKHLLRERARARLDNPTGTVTFAAVGGSVSVNFPTPKLRVQADRDVLLARLGPAYHGLFRERITVTPVSDFREAIMSEAYRHLADTVSDVVAEVDETPRVSFRHAGRDSPT